MPRGRRIVEDSDDEFVLGAGSNELNEEETVSNQPSAISENDSSPRSTEPSLPMSKPRELPEWQVNRTLRGRRATIQSIAVANAQVRGWQSDEDMILRQHVEAAKGRRMWETYSQDIPGRSAKACRLRWDRLVEAKKTGKDIGKHGPARASSTDVAPLDQGTAQLFEYVVGWLRGSHPTFNLLLAEVSFADLATVVQDLFAVTEFQRATKSLAGTVQKNPLDIAQVLTLSSNDHACRESSSFVGMLRTDSRVSRGSSVYYAPQRWTTLKQQEYLSFEPRRRLALAGPFIQFLWSDPDLPVLPIVTSICGANDLNPEFELVVPQYEWDSVESGKDVGPLLLLFTTSQVLFGSLADVVSSKNGDDTVGTCSNATTQGDYVEVFWSRCELTKPHVRATQKDILPPARRQRSRWRCWANRVR